MFIQVHSRSSFWGQRKGRDTT